MLLIQRRRQKPEVRGGSQEDDDDDDDEDGQIQMLSVVEDISLAVMTSLDRQQALQRQLDDLTSAQARQTRDLMTSRSRDADWLRGWLDDERRMRRELMTSQELLQKALVDCLSAACSRQMSPVTVRRHY